MRVRNGINLQPENIASEAFLHAIGDRWMELPHSETRQRGLVLLPGESVSFLPCRIGSDSKLRVVAQPAVPAISNDGLDLVLWLDVHAESGPSAHRLGVMGFSPRQSPTLAASVEFDLAPWAGHEVSLRLACEPGGEGDATNDWVAVVALALADESDLHALLARSQYDWRLANEASRFAGVYDDAIYAGRVRHRGATRVESAVDAMPQDPVDQKAHRLAMAEAALVDLQPVPGETPLAFGSRLLSRLIGAPRPDFASRVFNWRGDRAFRVLSLCSGTAGVEATLLASAAGNVDLTLVDVSPALLTEASRRQPPNVTVRTVVAPVEEYLPPTGWFDVVCFVSGLHHVIELESVLGRLAASLNERGELWLIGEQVGRNGSRLHSDALAVADPIFADLPERLRWNRELQRVDDRFPNPDYSTSCFEGIRSADIPDALSRWFLPEETDLRNCFLWRFVNLTYAANFDLTNSEDVRHLKRIAAADAVFWSMGGRGTELNGVFRPKAIYG
ncbi:MAG: class I SAM-dependent methyltransferase [Fimbriimonadaceae bacterium]